MQSLWMVAASWAYSTVAFSSIFGTLVWHDRLPLMVWLGIALIVASGLAATSLSRAGPVEQD